MDEIGGKSLTELWAEMLDLKKPEWKKATLQTYQKTWNVVFSRFWGGKPASFLNSKSVQDFKSFYLTVFPKREPSKIKIHLKVFVDYLLVQGALSSPPDLSCLDDLQKIVQRNARRVKVGRVLTKLEAIKLQEAAIFYPVEWAGAAVLLSLSAGMRKNEILDPEGIELDEKNGLLKIWSQKNSKWREIYLNSITGGPSGSKILKYLKDSRVRSKYSSQALDSHWAKIKRSAGISGRLRFHDLRHTFATKTAEANWPPISACQILDMSLGVYQKVYAKPSVESVAELFKRL